MTGYSGRITTTGKSEAIRLDKALFRLHPEFRQKARVRAHVIAPGRLLVTVERPARRAEEDDPVLGAFLALLARDLEERPERLTPLARKTVARARRLTRRVRVSDDQRLPDDVTL
jgi:antitoxin PrlF